MNKVIRWLLDYIEEQPVGIREIGMGLCIMFIIMPITNPMPSSPNTMLMATLVGSIGAIMLLIGLVHLAVMNVLYQVRETWKSIDELKNKVKA